MTQGLPALATPCRDTGHGCDSGSKGLCRDPSHSAPAPNPVATPKFYRNMGLSNHCRDREFSVAIEELWAISVVIGLPPRHAPMHSVASGIYVARATVRAAAPLCHDTGHPVATQLKMGSSPPWPPFASSFFFPSSFPFQNTINSM